MRRPVTDKQLDPVFRAVQRHPAGASLDEVLAAVGSLVPRRTLQRWLALLVAQRRIIAEGATRSRRYRAVESAPAVRSAGGERPAEATTIAGKELDPLGLSVAAKEIRRLVTRPLTRRKPVGYDITFLDGYRLNISAYLSPALRKKLAVLGRTTSGTLPAGTHLRKVMDRLLIDLSWNSSRLEGNTYSLLETQRLLEAGEAAEGKAAHETQMILNHKAAIELLAEHSNEIGFNRYTLCNLHALLAENLLPDPAAVAPCFTRWK
jgi:hypothetical protein